jgi:thiol-disulfide isomerase/thioredoxin
MRIKLIIFFLGLSFTILAQHNFVINGKCLKNVNSKSIYLTYNINGKSITKSSEIHKNKFVFDGKIDYPTKAIICTDPDFNLTKLNSKIFYLEPRIININLYFDDLNTILINNSKTNDEFYTLQNSTEKEKIHKKIDSIREFSKFYSDKIISTTENSLKIHFQKSLDSLNQLADHLVDQNINLRTQLNFEFVKKNPSSFITPDLLYDLLKNGQIQYDTIKNLYNKLTPKVKKSNGGKQLAEKLIVFKNSSIGGLASDFQGKDINGNPIQLISYRYTKYVLLDFWASWCTPCREDFTFLKELYSKYKDKGFEIISVSKDKKLDSWRNAIVKENIVDWKHFSIKENNSNIEETYLVNAIPLKILINKEGVIIGRWMGTNTENETEIQKAITELFFD